MKVHLVSLGCSRTLVDSEVALGGLVQEGYTVVRELAGADVAIVNTCGFIEEAKRESIETILSLCELKKKGRLKAVVVLGCLAQRYGAELAKEIKEADGIIGTNNYGDLARVLEPIQRKQKVFEVKGRPRYLLDEGAPRYSLTPEHFAYVKISEGCINACSYCVIPQMKGPHRSRSVDSVLSEIRDLYAKRRPSEINLVGQDTAAFGYDRDKRFQLPELLKKIESLGLARWVRLLYAHPGHVTEELIEVMAESPSICKYVDFPIEHSHDAMLKRMNRDVTREKMEWGIRRFRERIPNVAIRTTVIVGFPGETDEEFEDLMAFLKAVRFEKLGAFKFSQEEGSRAYGMPGQIPEKVKEERFHAVMAQQREISETIQSAQIGQKLQILVDERSAEEPGLYYGRTQSDAPDVDGQVIIHSDADLKAGDFIEARITDALEYDLIATYPS